MERKECRDIINFVATILRWTKLNFVATLPKFFATQFKGMGKNFVSTIISLLQQSLKRNASKKCCDKSTTKDEDIEVVYMA